MQLNSKPPRGAKSPSAGAMCPAAAGRGAGSFQSLFSRLNNQGSKHKVRCREAGGRTVIILNINYSFGGTGRICIELQGLSQESDIYSFVCNKDCMHKSTFCSCYLIPASAGPRIYWLLKQTNRLFERLFSVEHCSRAVIYGPWVNRSQKRGRQGPTLQYVRTVHIGREERTSNTRKF